jgi:pyruvate carboxylase
MRGATPKQENPACAWPWRLLCNDVPWAMACAGCGWARDVQVGLKRQLGAPMHLLLCDSSSGMAADLATAISAPYNVAQAAFDETMAAAGGQPAPAAVWLVAAATKLASVIDSDEALMQVRAI